jgi:non-specific protein-tyrosine kinase
MNDPLLDFSGRPQGSSRYLHALRQHWLLVVAVVAVAVGAAAAYSFTASKRYEAEADILITPLSGSDDTFVGIPGLLRETSVPNSSILTAARLVKTPAVAHEARHRLGTTTSAEELLKHVEARPLSQSSIVAIIGKAHSRDFAANLANAFAEAMIARRTVEFQRGLLAVQSRLRARLRQIPPVLRSQPEAAAIQQRLADLGAVAGAQDPTVEISSRAVPPASPSWPRPALSIAVALLASSLLGIALAIGLELVSPRITREDDLLVDHGLPVLARVPRLSSGTVREYLTGRGPLPAHVWEAYRTLRANLSVAGPDGGPPRSVLVTSAQPNEGKTMTAVNLAITAARAGARVVLVDGDLRKPMIATAFGVSSTRYGFVRMLNDAATTPEEALIAAPGLERLSLLLSTWEHAAVVDLLEPRRVERVISKLKETADLIVIDSPPLTEVADALSLADASEAVILAIRLGKGRRDRLADLRRMLSRRGIYPAGFVVTGRERMRGPGYYYGAAPEEPEPRRRRKEARGRKRTRARRLDDVLRR